MNIMGKTSTAILVLSLACQASAQSKAASASQGSHVGKLARLYDSDRSLLADGVWRPDGEEAGDISDDVVAHLECYKTGGREVVGTDAYCMEATATVAFSDLPTVDVKYYEVSLWNSDRVIASDSFDPFPICVRTQITIDRRDRSVIATDTRKLGKGHEGLNNVCEKMPFSQKYHLVERAAEIAGRRSLPQHTEGKTK